MLQKPVVIPSSDGSLKLVFTLKGSEKIHAVYIPKKNRVTLCLSCQIGCALDCGFCLTGLLEFKGNFSCEDILSQIQWANDLFANKVTNVVLMGMGEPFYNLTEVSKAVRELMNYKTFNIAPRKITVSTAGVIDGIDYWAKHFRTSLAVSVIAANDQKRGQLMSINKQYPLKDLVQAIERYTLKTNKKVFCEYIMIEGLTDQDDDLTSLHELFKGLRVSINLIPYNENSVFGFKRSSQDTILNFRKRLMDMGLFATIRYSAGQDVYAACGQLHG